MAQRQGIFKSVAVVGGLISLLAVATYPVIVHPKMHPEKYRESHQVIFEAHKIDKIVSVKQIAQCKLADTNVYTNHYHFAFRRAWERGYIITTSPQLASYPGAFGAWA